MNIELKTCGRKGPWFNSEQLSGVVIRVDVDVKRKCLNTSCLGSQCRLIFKSATSQLQARRVTTFVYSVASSNEHRNQTALSAEGKGISGLLSECHLLKTFSFAQSW
jgi:hypothetical protein